jgi:hypothetical protein
MSSIHFLRVPYLARLDNTIQPGQSLIIRGVGTGKKIDINLATGPAVDGYAGDNIALHISWRQPEKAIVLNSFENGQWKKEERHKDTGMHENEPFDLRVRAHDDRFEIFLQHKKLADFQYRLPINAITHLFVMGDLRLQALAWEGNYYPIPYKGGVPGGHFGPGRKLFITGVPDKDCKKFEIDLYSGHDIAFHFNPRLSEKVVVRNSKQGGNWGNEERDGGQPFAKEKQFDVVIVSEGDALQVYVNGEHHSTFRNRIPAQQIDGLGIEGDLQLQAIAFD